MKSRVGLFKANTRMMGEENGIPSEKGREEEVHGRRIIKWNEDEDKEKD